MSERKRKYLTAFGISPESANLSAIERFHLSENEYEKFLKWLAANQYCNVFVLNTCNRTEIYCESDALPTIIGKFRSIKQLSNEQLHNCTFIKYDKEAVSHLMEVGAGIKSKILGDYQIIGQIRTAFNSAKAYGLIDTLFERLFQVVFATSKEISHTTKFNSGTASYGYQVARIINNLNLPQQTKILVLGAGDMAQKTLNHLIDYCTHDITVSNRTYKNMALFKRLRRVSIVEIDRLNDLINSHAVIVSTIPVDDYFKNIDTHKLQCRYIFDLAMPLSISKQFDEEQHTRYNIEEIALSTREAISRRATELPTVKNIIERHITTYYNWIKANNQNQVFRLFEAELEQFLIKQTLHQSDKENKNLTKEITQLFMKNYYKKLNIKKVG